MCSCFSALRVTFLSLKPIYFTTPFSVGESAFSTKLPSMSETVQIVFFMNIDAPIIGSPLMSTTLPVKFYGVVWVAIEELDDPMEAEAVR